MEDSSSVPPVYFRRNFQNLPKRKQGEKKKKDREENTGTEEEREERKSPPSPDGTSTIDLTA